MKPVRLQGAASICPPAVVRPHTTKLADDTWQQKGPLCVLVLCAVAHTAEGGA